MQNVDSIKQSSLLNKSQIRAAAKFAGIKIVKKSVERICQRCAGSGVFFNHGICFRCGGSKVDPINENVYLVDPACKNYAAFVDRMQEIESNSIEARKNEQEKIKAENEKKKQELMPKVAEFKEVQKAQVEKVKHIIDALQANGSRFAIQIAAELENNEKPRGRGLIIASEIAAKQMLGKSRMSKEVRKLADAIESEIEQMQCIDGVEFFGQNDWQRARLILE